MLNIDKLRHNWENHSRINGRKKGKVHPDEPHKTLWYKNNEWYFEQDEKMVNYGVKLIEYGHF